MMTNKRRFGLNRILFAVSNLFILQPVSRAEDWPMFGRDASRNPVSRKQSPPLDWEVGTLDRKAGQWVNTGRNARWIADLGVGGFPGMNLQIGQDGAPMFMMQMYRVNVQGTSAGGGLARIELVSGSLSTN